VAIKQIRSSPHELPAAHLFLGDVEEITEIVANLVGAGVNKPDPSTIKYSVGDRECDTVGDLKKIGGKTKKFGIEAPTGFLIVGSRNSFYTTFGGEESWTAYGKVRAIFDHRSSRVLSVMNDANLPTSGVFVLSFALPLFLLALMKVRSSSLYLSEVLWLVLLIAIWSQLINKRSVVELRYFDEANSQRSKEIRPLVWGIWGAVIGGAVGSIITVLGERFVKWLFP
jgi:hypothetical protein